MVSGPPFLFSKAMDDTLDVMYTTRDTDDISSSNLLSVSEALDVEGLVLDFPGRRVESATSRSGGKARPDSTAATSRKQKRASVAAILRVLPGATHPAPTVATTKRGPTEDLESSIVLVEKEDGEEDDGWVKEVGAAPAEDVVKSRRTDEDGERREARAAKRGEKWEEEARKARTEVREGWMNEPWIQESQGLEVFYIRRALNPGDLWSGHMAFPGGRVEEGETDYDAAVRETWEEVGIDLTQGPSLNLARDEVASAHWISVDLFLPPTFTFGEAFPSSLHPVPAKQWSPIRYPVLFFNAPVRRRPGTPGRSPLETWLRQHLQVPARWLMGELLFHGVVLPGRHHEDEVVIVNKDGHDRLSIAESSRMVLWGLTLWMTSDLMDLMHGVLPKGIQMPPRSLMEITPPRFTHWDMQLAYLLLSGWPIQKLMDWGLLLPQRKPFGYERHAVMRRRLAVMRRRLAALAAGSEDEPDASDDATDAGASESAREQRSGSVEEGTAGTLGVDVEVVEHA
ncbi:hypothetical protein HDU96_006303 [Phlyctochytrium bullatum]|nr:hypothetical protein HDU96_006303 [Phlyctochytrium bullatum]